MGTTDDLNLIRLFDFYLALMFLMSLMRRWPVYFEALRLLWQVRGRWPKLMRRLSQHRSLLLNWAFFRPVIAALALMGLQLLASRLIWPQAQLTVRHLQTEWWLVPILIIAALPMLAVDTYFLIRVGRFDYEETARYMTLAEDWLGWKGTVVRVVTLGLVNPHHLVDEELRKSLFVARHTFSSALWWVCIQSTCRIFFGLTLWTLWAFHG